MKSMTQVNRIVKAIGLDTIDAEEISRRVGKAIMSVQLVGSLTPRQRKGAKCPSPTDHLVEHVGDHVSASGTKMGLFRLKKAGRDLFEVLRMSVDELASKATVDPAFAKATEAKDLPLGLLIIDESYQRDLQKPNPKWGAFAPGLAGSIEVSKRPGGVYAVMDGQHRLALARRDGASFLRANVHSDLKVADEARFWIYFNRHRRQPNPTATVKARARANDASAIGLIADLAAAGYHFSGGKKNRVGGIRGAGYLEKVRNKGIAHGVDDALKRAAFMYKAVWPTHDASANFIMAFAGVLIGTKIDRTPLDEAGFRKRMAKCGHAWFVDWLRRENVVGNRAPIRLGEEMIRRYMDNRKKGKVDWHCVARALGETI